MPAPAAVTFKKLEDKKVRIFCQCGRAHDFSQDDKNKLTIETVVDVTPEPKKKSSGGITTFFGSDEESKETEE